MIYILFIESVKAKEWEVGAIIHHSILHNPEYQDVKPYITYVNNKEEFKLTLTDVSKLIKDDSQIVIQIDAHSNQYELGFRDQQMIIDDTQNILLWDDVTKLCSSLFRKFGERITFIFASCLSALYFENISSLQMNVIAAENEIYPKRVEEQLLAFYQSYCTGNSVEQAYNDMVSKFPLEAELDRDEKKRSILKLFK